MKKNTPPMTADKPKAVLLVMALIGIGVTFLPYETTAQLRDLGLQLPTLESSAETLVFLGEWAVVTGVAVLTAYLKRNYLK